jgi:hypothetical protein
MAGLVTAPRASTSSAHSLDLPSLQPLSHSHPILTAPTFSADDFLLSRIHIPLEELRGELREYLGLLREELVQLINDDYEEFISLGTGLRGEGERLRNLERPLKELGGRVSSVRDVLAGVQARVQDKLDERAVMREERALLDLLQRLFETLSRAEILLGEEGVQRVAGEYTQLVYLLEKARSEGCAIVDAVEPVSAVLTWLIIAYSCYKIKAWNRPLGFATGRTGDWAAGTSVTYIRAHRRMG